MLARGRGDMGHTLEAWAQRLSGPDGCHGYAIDDDLRIQVAKSDIAESILPGGSHFKLSDLHDHPLFFAPQATLRPDPKHLAWHRREVFTP